VSEPTENALQQRPRPANITAGPRTTSPVGDANEQRELMRVLLAAAAAQPPLELRTPGDLAGAFLRGFDPDSTTRREYARDLAGMFLWLARCGVSPFDATRDHLSDWIAQPKPSGQPYASATLARRLACAAGFYRYAVDEELVPRNPTVRLRRPKVSDRSTTLGLGKKEARELLRAADGDPRDAALARLLLHNGLRITEAVNVDIEDLGRDNDFDVLRLRGKGERDKKTIVPLNNATKRAILTYAGERTSGPLFVSRTGRRLTRQEAARIVRRLCRHARIDPLGPHGLRHTFVTLALDEGVSLRDVQDAARHADPRTTRRYDRGRNSLARHPTHKLLGVLED
jgi:integrase/recombinase XerD